MKKIFFYYSILLFSISLTAHSQTISYSSGGALFENKVLRRPKDVRAMLEPKMNPDLENAFSSYSTYRTTSTILANVGGGLTGIYLGSSLRGANIDKGLLYAGLGTILISFVINTQANKSMKEIVSLYNKGEQRDAMLFSPNKKDNTFNEIGIAIRF
jgi:hypothetical protein